MDAQVSLVSSFIPDSVLLCLKSGKKGDKTEALMIKVTKLLVKLMQEAADNFVKGRYTRFDANPGDSGCQNQALELGRIASLDLDEECHKTASIAEKIKDAYINRNKADRKEKRGQCSPFEFFQSQFDVKISKEMCYLLHCYLGTVMRVAVQTLDNGVVHTQSNFDRLGKLVGNTRVIGPNLLKDILMKNQEELSARSVAAVEAVAAGLLCGESEKKLMTRMLAQKKVRETPGYRPKTFGCLFFEVKALALMAREKREVVCLRKILKKGDKAMRIFMQAQKSGSALEAIPSSDVSFETPVIVFEGVVTGSREEVCAEIREKGFTNLILRDAAFAPPFDPLSTLEDIRDPEGRSEVQRFYDLGRPVTFSIDHVYLSCKEESGLCQEGRPWIVV